jgi:transcriptional regulator with XRE-family HTH domain
MDQSAPNQFRTALTYLLKKEGRGAQTRLAEKLNIDRGYLNAIVRGRKSGSEKKRCEIAEHFQMLYEDMLTLGRRLLDDEEAPIHESNANKSISTLEIPGTSKLPKEFFGKNLHPTHGRGSDDIPDRIVRVIEVLNSGTEYADLLAGMIDTFHDTVSTKKKNLSLEKENSDLKAELQAMNHRIANLERRPEGEKELMQKSA